MNIDVKKLRLSANVKRIAPIIQAMSDFNGSVSHYLHRMSFNAPFTMTLCDSPIPKPKRITDAYRARMDEFRAALELALGDCWAVVETGSDRIDDCDVLFVPLPPTLVYNERGGKLYSGLNRRSWNSLKVSLLVKRFQSPELKTAWQICR